MIRSASIAVALTVSIILAACSGGAAPDPAESSSGEEAGSMAVVFSSRIDDRTFSQSGYEALEQIKAAGWRTSFLESVAPDKMLESVRNYAQQGFKIVVGFGGQFMDPVTRIAEEFPDTQFIVVNGLESGGNVTSLTTDFREVGFLAGVIAGTVTQTGSTGLVEGVTIPIAELSAEGFYAGVNHVSPDIEIQRSTTGSFTDIQKAREAALTQIRNGVDVIWAAVDAASIGVYGAAEDEGARVISFFGDISQDAPNAFIGAPDTDPGKLLLGVLESQDVLDGGVHYFGVASGAVSYVLSANSPAELDEILKQAVQDLKDGKVVIK